MTAVGKAFAAQGRHGLVATQDWHPPGHASFTSRGGQWPDHCVQESHGAAFHPALELPEGTRVVRKGASSDRDAYSGFVDSDLVELLRSRGVTPRLRPEASRPDYCVLNTVVDALSNGYETYVLTDAIGAVDVEPGDGDRALHLMEFNGAVLTTAGAVLQAC